MKQLVKTILLISLFGNLLLRGYSQSKDSAQAALRIYEDNDFMNIYDPGSDGRYTNGTRGDVFYTRSRKPSSVFYKLSPKTSQGNISTYSWGIMQVMITPSNIKTTLMQPNDYPYSGALFAEHSFHFADPSSKTNIQTDWIIGVMGPLSLAKQTQVLVHNVEGYPSPKGWQYQLPNDLLLNYNINFEKGISGNGKTWDIIANPALFAGSMLDGISLSTQLRFGNLPPYFEGRITQVFAGRKKLTVCASLEPGIDLVFYNALLEGGLFNPDSPVRNRKENYSQLKKEIFKTHLNMQVMFAFKKATIAFTQKTFSKDFKGLTGEGVGNISLYVKLK